MAEYTPTIGLEVHAELKTRTKMFCDSKNDPEETRPNVNICPVCMGHPGTLPVINKAAVAHVLLFGRAVGAALADFTEFDRKNYFYPDIPKGYQISQYAYPLVSGGELADVALTRVHLEEDTARSVHPPAQAGDADPQYSLVDFNRAGVPLMELVTEPVIKTGEEAGRFARELQLLLRYLGASDANLEKGEMRIEANVSISDSEAFGTKVEVKNLNSFRSVERAIAYEIKRQEETLASGKTVAQETRGWDENAQKTFSQRAKEESHDYRYFPDPDLPKIVRSEIPEFSDDALDGTLPELPWQRRARLAEQFALRDESIAVLVNNKTLGDFFEASVEPFADNKQLVQTAANYLTSDLIGFLNDRGVSFAETKITADAFGALMHMAAENNISSRGAKDLLRILAEEGGTAEAQAKQHGLLQRSDAGELAPVVERILAENPDAVSEYKNGKTTAVQFLVGQGMKETNGAANPAVLKQLIEEKLDAQRA